MIRALGFMTWARSGFGRRPRVHFDGEPNLATWRDLAGGWPPLPKPLPAPPAPPARFTLTEPGAAANGRAVAYQDLRALVDVYGLETVAEWLGVLAAVRGRKVVLERS